MADDKLRQGEFGSQGSEEQDSSTSDGRQSKVHSLQEKLLQDCAELRLQVDNVLQAYFHQQSEVIHSHFMDEHMGFNSGPGDYRSEERLVLPGDFTPRRGPTDSMVMHAIRESPRRRKENPKGTFQTVMDDFAELAQLDGRVEDGRPRVQSCRPPIRGSTRMTNPTLSRSFSSEDFGPQLSSLPLWWATCLGRLFSCIDWWRSIQEPERDGRVFRFVYSRTISLTCASVIALNAFVAILATDYEAAHYLDVEEASAQYVAMLDLFFLIFYTIEISLKLSIHKLYFFANREWHWNCFDLFLVLSNMVDVIIYVVTARSGGHRDSTYLRFFRILKLAKVLRIIRMFRLISELRLMMNSVIGSLGSLFWSVIVILFVLYIFGIVFVQFVTTFFEELGAAMDPDLQQLFGSVSKAMLTLYMCATGGIDWQEVYDALSATEWKNVVVFLVYMVFIQIAVLNIVTGIFVENAMKLAQPDHESRAQQQHKKYLADAEDLRSLCIDIDSNNNGAISVGEFVAAYRTNCKLRAKFAVLGLDINDAVVFFDMLRALDDDSEEIDIEVFVGFCLRLQGSATSIDLHHLLLELRIGHRKQQCFNKHCMMRLDQFAHKLHSCTQSDKLDESTRRNPPKRMKSLASSGFTNGSASSSAACAAPSSTAGAASEFEGGVATGAPAAARPGNVPLATKHPLRASAGQREHKSVLEADGRPLGRLTNHCAAGLLRAAGDRHLKQGCPILLPVVPR